MSSIGARDTSANVVLGVESSMLGLMTMFEPLAANGLQASYELRLGDQVFRATVARLLGLFATLAPAVALWRDTVGAVTAYRFQVPPEHALLTLADASGGLSALFAFDAHMAHHLAWLNEAAAGLGYDTDADEEMKDTRALANAQTEPIRALRTELAELAADAEAQLPPDVFWAGEIVAERPLRTLPDTLGPKELAYVEQSYRTGMTKLLLAACESLGPLAERLRAVDDEECRSFADRTAAFVVSVRGPGPGPEPVP